MISKEKVNKIITDVDVIRAKKESGEDGLVDLKKAEYTLEEKELYAYLKALSKSEYMDLCALAELGRTCVQNSVSPTLSNYKQERKNFEYNHKYEEIFPQYLLGKSQLSTYLRKVLCLFDEKEFDF